MFKHHLRIPAKTEYLSLIRSTLKNLLEREKWALRDIHPVILAVDEALTNIMEHAASQNKEEPVHIIFHLTPRYFFVSIRHKGKPFNPKPVSKQEVQARLQKRQRGGYGLYLMHTLMDTISYRTTPQGNELVMKKVWRKR